MWPYGMRGDSDSAPHSHGLKIHTRPGQGCVSGSARPWKVLLGSRKVAKQMAIQQRESSS